MAQTDSPFKPGTRVNHRDLGDGTVSVVEGNDITVDFDNRGPINFSLSQIMSWLSLAEPPKKEVKEDCFIGDVIDRSPLIRPDVAYRHVDNDLNVPVKFAHKEEIPVGTSVWHPSFGVCTVSSVDAKKNEIVLDHSDGSVSLVLSQSKSWLAILDEPKIQESKPEPAKVPSKMMVDEKLPAPVKEFPLLEVTLPKSFSSLRPQEQYLYLKSTLRLTGDQANDVLAVFNGNKPLYSKVSLQVEGVN